jgi:putative hydrolase of the HAD superfamily
MKIGAVVFDLFGTLVPPFSLPGHRALVSSMATLLSVPVDVFEEAWGAAYPERGTGAATPAEQMVEISRCFGQVELQEAIVADAMDLRVAFFRRTLQPRRDSVEVLRALRERALKLGVVSDCSCEAPLVWPTTQLASLIDVAVFSCEIGCRKPDPKIYRAATEALEVPPSRCLYVGDGGSQELSGAEQAGMNPVLLRVPEEQDADAYLLDEREKWSGPVVASLRELFPLIDQYLSGPGTSEGDPTRHP